MDAPMVIAGLGNPGREYVDTRHNAGFLVLETLANRWQAGWENSRRFRSRLARVRRGGRTVWLCAPQTYMNLSGEAVAAMVRFHQVPLGALVVVVDDADLPLGALRLRPQGSSGGHHGLESVERELGTRAYARQRVGIGRVAEGRREITGHVLGRFGALERPRFVKVLERAADQLECWVAEGMAAAMQRFNGVVGESEAEGEVS